MSLQPLMQKDDWHNYAGLSVDHPAPLGYIKATSDFVENLKKLLCSDQSHPEMKQSLLTLILDREQFIQFTENYMFNHEYENHPANSEVRQNLEL